MIDILPEQKAIEGLGGNMRLGGQPVRVKPNTLAAFLYRVREHDEGGVKGGGPHEPFTVRERFRHRYEVDPRYIEQLEAAGLVFSGATLSSRSCSCWSCRSRFTPSSSPASSTRN